MKYPCLALLALPALACQPPEFVCTMDMECVATNGGYGKCVQSHCAFVDPSCPSGWRFDDTAASQANKCVDPTVITPPDASPVDASPVDASPVDASPVDASSVDASSVDASPVDASSVDAPTIDAPP